MLYKDTAPAIMQMEDAKAGQLFKAILLADEEEPVFDDSELRLAWAFISPRIQEDAEKYRTISEKRRLAGQRGALVSNCRQVLASGSHNKSKHNKSYHNNLDQDIVGKPPTRHEYGEYRNVLLSDEDLSKLQADFPNDWQQRIERLSEYIATSGKAYKSHLATIRSWAKKDKPKQGIELGGGQICSL